MRAARGTKTGPGVPPGSPPPYQLRAEIGLTSRGAISRRLQLDIRRGPWLVLAKGVILGTCPEQVGHESLLRVRRHASPAHVHGPVVGQYLLSIRLGELDLLIDTGQVSWCGVLPVRW